ncbi:methylenetetrahydromethanopterin dehydrogenase [Ramlibacter sp. USB13]|uniref:Methylenetetrahydromethanopterin dehydrogenase n=1 Tax=Ramlibacter cellulosilyticus TaxID=2764187 RepID=A0A923MM98_9BURK|nr:NAD(P)-dependent methylenetetrahydromethanopterin dehydrogenase [Ramlibacter cellulosilyticus]MBC5782222.1 methylenetetrahydromethanopterin dehydrogenase [Ramlibacter cellulosilyticus]
MERPYVLHLFTPGPRVSPFDVNMAADAGWEVLMPYTGVAADDVASLVQDAIFSRGPKGAARTGLFVGGRDVLLADEMLARARKAMFPPFVVSLCADPSGAYTTSAAMVACTETALGRADGGNLEGREVLLLGGTGPVGRIAAVLCARRGAHAVLGSHRGADAAEAAAAATGERFGVAIDAVSTANAGALRAALAEAEVVMAVAGAGVQVAGEDDLATAKHLRVAVDLNAVPPSGLAGVGASDDGKPLAGTSAVGIGALAVGNIKFKVQHALLARMRESERPVVLGFEEAYALAREVLAGKDH